MHHKDAFNRTLGIIIACVGTLAWIGTLVATRLPHDEDPTVATFIVPVILLWAMFLGLTRHQEPIGGAWANRRGWVIAGLCTVVGMELISLVNSLV